MKLPLGCLHPVLNGLKNVQHRRNGIMILCAHLETTATAVCTQLLCAPNCNCCVHPCQQASLHSTLIAVFVSSAAVASPCTDTAHVEQ
jgi:hypothetical protein